MFILRRLNGCSACTLLSPWRPFETRAAFDPQLRDSVVHTVGRLEDLRALGRQSSNGQGRPRVVLERLTSMRRHGLSARDLREAASMLDDVSVEGTALHLDPVTATALTHPE